MGFEIQVGEFRYEKFLRILDYKFDLMKLAKNFREFRQQKLFFYFYA